MITKEEAIKAYEDLIQLRRSEVLVKDKSKLGSIEIHHILPTSCGGIDNDENKIALYAKEHFMAHVYLWIIHHEDEFHNQTICALNNMVKGTSNGSRKELRDFIFASEEYQKAREEFAQYASRLLSESNLGSKNHSYGKHWYYDPVTLSSNQFFDNEVPKGYLPGRKFKDLNRFSKKVSEYNKGRIWIHKKDLTKQSLRPKEEAEQLVSSGEWDYGHLGYTEQQNKNRLLKNLETQLKNGTRTEIYKERKRYPLCLNCGKDNPNKYAQCCCNECKNEYQQKICIIRLRQKHLDEAESLKEKGYFDCQTTKLYKGVINRKQVHRYLKITGHLCCNHCGKTNVKLIVHAIDGNCRNNSIDNYEFLCRECYFNTETAGFSGHSMKQINESKKVDLQIDEDDL